MIRRIAQSILSSYYKPVEKFAENPIEFQQNTFDYLIEHGKNTLFGHEKAFAKITGKDDFRKRVPVSSYEDLRPYLDQIIVEKKENVLWDSPVKWFAMSSGTTEDKSKYIPVTEESLKNSHYRAGYQMLGMYARHYPDSAFIFGKSMVLGGSKQLNQIGDGIFTGDISAILIKNLPVIAKRARTPEDIALIADWEEKLQKLTEYAVKTDIRSLVGVPSWMLVLLKKITEVTGKTIPEVWPNIEVFFHGGVSFLPFEEQFRKIIPKDGMRYWETYNASEGFFGVQFTPESKDMLLLLNNEIYYEFLPVEEWNSENPKALTLEEVEAGKQYALVISTSGGLWRYKIGDTIEFTFIRPYLFRVTGRTKHFINAFGEELIIDNADKALDMACKATNAKINEYTAAPVYFGDSHNGAHEWLIEFELNPADMDLFAKTLDDSLKKLNSDYEAKRSYNLSLGEPVVRSLPQGSFYRWMDWRGKAGGQNKVPRLSNDRNIVESLLEFLSGKS